MLSSGVSWARNGGPATTTSDRLCPQNGDAMISGTTGPLGMTAWCSSAPRLGGGDARVPSSRSQQDVLLAISFFLYLV